MNQALIESDISFESIRAANKLVDGGDFDSAMRILAGRLPTLRRIHDGALEDGIVEYARRVNEIVRNRNK
jgi:hypothetical protein